MARLGLQLMMLTVVLACVHAVLTLANLVVPDESVAAMDVLAGLARFGAGVAGVAGSMMCLHVPHEARARSAGLVAAALFALAFLLGALHFEGRWPDLLILGGLAVFLRYVQQLARWLGLTELAAGTWPILAWPVFGVVAVIGSIPLGLVLGSWAILGPLTALALFAYGGFLYARALHLLVTGLKGKLLTPALT